MTRLRRLLMYGCLAAVLCGFLEPCCNPAFCDSAKDWIKQEKEAFQAAREQEAANYYSKAVEMANYSKAIEADPNLVEKQEEWVREKLKSGKSADLLERIDVKLSGKDSLPVRKDLIEKHGKELIIRASFLEKLIADELNDAKAYRKGIEIKNAVVIGDLDLSKAEIAPSITISNRICLGKVDLNNSWFQRGLNLDGSHFLGAADFEFLKVDKSAGFRATLFNAEIAAEFDQCFSAEEKTHILNLVRLQIFVSCISATFLRIPKIKVADGG
jgi:hypothetical protein